MNRITKPTFPNTSSRTLNINRRSITLTFGNRPTTACWNRADTSGDGTRVISNKNCGACSSTPDGNNTGKIG